MVSRSLRTAVPAGVICLSLQALALSADLMGVFDTGAASGVVLPGRVVGEREGWSRIAEGELPGRFKGDAAFSNGRITVVLRKGGPGRSSIRMEGRHYVAGGLGAGRREGGGGGGCRLWRTRRAKRRWMPLSRCQTAAGPACV